MEEHSLPIIFAEGAKTKNTFFRPSMFNLLLGSDFLHYHDVLELGVCLNGTGKYITVDSQTPFRVGDVQVIFPFQPHYNIADEGGSLWTFIDFDLPRINSPHVSTDPAFFLELARNTSASGIYTEDKHPAIVSLVRSIATLVRSEHSAKSPISDLIAVKLCTLLLELSMSGDGVGAVSESNKRSEAILPAICLASEAIEKGRKISPSDMAAECFMSESYFRRIFSGVMGEPPKNYLIRLQIKKAAALLVTTKLSVSEIARRTCFEDNSTFYRRFVSAYGQSPIAYRQRAEKRTEFPEK